MHYEDDYAFPGGHASIEQSEVKNRTLAESHDD
jgi:hypothetical protein